MRTFAAFFFRAAVRGRGISHSGRTHGCIEKEWGIAIDLIGSFHQDNLDSKITAKEYLQFCSLILKVSIYPDTGTQKLCSNLPL